MKKSLLAKPAAAVFAMLTTCGLLFAYNNLGFADSAQPSRSSVTSVAPVAAADLSDSKGQVSADGTSAQGKDSTSAKANNRICAAGRFSKYPKVLKTSTAWPN